MWVVVDNESLVAYGPFRDLADASLFVFNRKVDSDVIMQFRYAVIEHPYDHPNQSTISDYLT